MNRGVRTGAVVLAGVLLTGCGAAPVPRAAGPSSPGSPSTSAATPGSATTPPASDGNGTLVPTNLPTQAPTATTVPTAASAPVLGADASWPQCPKGMGIAQKRSEGAPMPTAAARFVVLGLTNGPSFVANPCLADQVAWVASRHLRAAAYAIVSYPDPRTLRRYGATGPFGTGPAAALRNTGYAAARFNLATMRAAGLRSPVVWVDVEPVTGFAWSDDPVANAAVVQGVARGYSDAGLTVGYYSTPSLWKRVVGYLPTGSPEWRAAGQTSRAEALRRCAPDWSFSGGDAVLGQWVEDGRDRDLTCPGVAADLGRWFHQY